jgi:hypothetical protein
MTQAHIDFQKLLDRQGIKYFSAKEVLTLGASNSYLRCNRIPARALWADIIPTLYAADAIRERLGVPVRIISAYRNEKYNKAIGGALHSYHVKFMALDIIAKVPVPEIVKIAKQVRAEGIFSGGIGIYAGFVHIDCRSKNTDWHG